MQFNRQKLVDTLERAITEHRKRYDDKIEKEKAEVAEHRQEWLDTMGPQWSDAAEKIIEMINDNIPVTEDVLPAAREMYSRIGVYRPMRARTVKDYVPPIKLIEFKEFLQLAQDEKITTNALKDHGFANLRDLTAYLREAVEKED